METLYGFRLGKSILITALSWSLSAPFRDQSLCLSSFGNHAIFPLLEQALGYGTACINQAYIQVQRSAAPAVLFGSL